MKTQSAATGRSLLSRWVRATFAGWWLGFVLVVVGVVLGDSVGGGAQVMIGVGMGAGVGYAQGRIAREWLGKLRPWMAACIIGMSVPFAAHDLAAALGFTLPYSLPFYVVLGGMLVSVWQWLLLRPHFHQSGWWVPASVLGWALPAGLVAWYDAFVGPGPFGAIIFLGMVFLGGLVLGGVTGSALMWKLKRTAA
jgi:hypothetical protein